MSRTRLKYLLLDLPSDHEVEGALATECDVLYSMLANHELAGVTKHVRIGSAKTLQRTRLYPYDAEVVHISGHATSDGLWMLGEVLKWDGVAKSLAACVSPLDLGRERIVNFSCCDSEKAARRCAKRLTPFFSGAYYFPEQSIAFAKSIATWTMFFYKQPTTANHQDIVKGISAFLGGEVLRYMPYRDEPLEELARLSGLGPKPPRRKKA